MILVFHIQEEDVGVINYHWLFRLNVLQWMPPGRWARRRPRVRWTERIQDAMKETELEGQ
jgi:hypothetical protein